MHKSQINEILLNAGSTPRHRFGQHFMIDENMLETIVAAADLSSSDVVLEIGPGVGNLTALLARRAAHVLAVDIDAPLLEAASLHWNSLINVRWLCADALAGKHRINPEVIAAIIEIQSLMVSARLKLVSNLPYNAASPLIAELLVAMWLSHRDHPKHPLDIERMVFTVQWEVAQRMDAKPGMRDYGALGILIQMLADVEILRPINRQCFWPPPKVRSALVRVTPRPQRFAAISDVLRLQQVLAAVFGHRRQNLGNAIRHGLHPDNLNTLLLRLSAAGIDPASRPANLLPSQLLTLCELVGP